MIFTNKKSVENLIFEHLQKGPVNTVALIQAIQRIRPQTTKQGVYAALRSLRHEEIIVTHNKQTSFNIRWLKQMGRFFMLAEQYHLTEHFTDNNFLNLKEGEAISYTFATPAQNDMFWGHALILLSESSIPASEPVYLYNPHEWFLIARKESERDAIDIITKKRRFLLTSGGNSPLDHAITGEFDGNRSQYHMLSKALFSKENYYCNVIGDFIIEAWIDKKTAHQIEQIYETSLGLDQEVRRGLISAIESKGRTKFSISRNAKKAEKLKKILKKNFYIPIEK